MISSGSDVLADTRVWQCALAGILGHAPDQEPELHKKEAASNWAGLN